jgi:hypothetical protein
MVVACSETERDNLITPMELTVEQVEPDSVVVHCLALDFKVVNFLKWKTAFDENDSLRKSFGFRSNHIFRKALDTNQVLLMMMVTDLDKASAFNTDPEVIAQMSEMGVIGQPAAKILNAVHFEQKIASQNLILMQYEVEDYKTWVKRFEETMLFNSNSGVKALYRLYVLDNPNMVSMLMEVSSFELAERLIGSPNNISSMKENGAISEPIMTFLKFIE